MKISSVKSVLTSTETFPLKDGEGVIQLGKDADKDGSYEGYTAYGDNMVYVYYHGSSGDNQIIEYTKATVNVENKGNYTFYDIENAQVDEDASYIWFTNKASIDGSGCDLEPGTYTAKELYKKCKIPVEIDLYYGYIFKTSAGGKEAYAAHLESEVGNIYENNKYESKSFSELKEIMDSYPQSSSVIIPSIMMVLALLFLLI